MNNAKIIMGLAIAFLLGLAIGYAIGYGMAIDKCVEVAVRFLDIEIKPEWKPVIISWLTGRT